MYRVACARRAIARVDRDQPYLCSRPVNGGRRPGDDRGQRDIFSRHRADRVRAVRRLSSSAGSRAIQSPHLLSRQATRDAIAQVTKARLMPPWKSEPGHGEFVGQVHLTDGEIDRFERWAAAGAPEGDPRRSPVDAEWTDGWQLGRPA